MKYIITTIKILLTISLVYFSLKSVNFNGMKSKILSDVGTLSIAICTILVFMQTAFAGYRLKPIMRLFNYDIKGRDGVGLWFLGNLCSQFLISFIGGDTMRVLSLNKAGVSYGSAMRAIFLDRVVGFVSLQALFIIGLPFLLPLLVEPTIYYTIIILAISSSVMIVGFFGMGLLPFNFTNKKIVIKILDISSMSRFLYFSKKLTLQIVILSFLMHVCTFVAIYFLTHMFGSVITIIQSFWIGAPVILLSMLPISIGGWGVRESSMIIGLGLVGVPADTALLVSIIIGLSFVIGSLPGIVFLLRRFSVLYSDGKDLQVEGV